jgi:hypothetical protein
VSYWWGSTLKFSAGPPATRAESLANMRYEKAVAAACCCFCCRE